MERDGAGQTAAEAGEQLGQESTGKCLPAASTCKRACHSTAGSCSLTRAVRGGAAKLRQQQQQALGDKVALLEVHSGSEDLARVGVWKGGRSVAASLGICAPGSECKMS